LDELGVPYQAQVLSAHRSPQAVARFAGNAARRGIRVIIAAAGAAAHLPGAVAAHTTLPVIGLPIATQPLQGMDALLSMVQMPKGVPVAVVGINGAANAALLAAQVLALQDKALAARLNRYRAAQQDSVRSQNTKLQTQLRKQRQEGS
jgi:phosphoribosylaminoimidazole carboxylase PurE protein